MVTARKKMKVVLPVFELVAGDTIADVPFPAGKYTTADIVNYFNEHSKVSRMTLVDRSTICYERKRTQLGLPGIEEE